LIYEIKFYIIRGTKITNIDSFAKGL